MTIREKREWVQRKLCWNDEAAPDGNSNRQEEIKAIRKGIWVMAISKSIDVWHFQLYYRDGYFVLVWILAY